VNLTDTDRSDIMETAEALADAARSVILPYFRGGGLETANKDAGGYDPVTAADRAAEQAMRAILAQRRPHDGILGEEFGTVAGTSGLTWILDPIDGTRGFVAGTPTWGVLIAAADETGPVYGVMDQPYVGERWRGGFGRSEFHGPLGARVLSVRGTQDLGDAILFSTFPEVGNAAEHAAFQRVVSSVQLTRYGMDCYAYGLVALGQVDLVIEAGLNSYDIAAPIAVIQAAGGIVTDWEGNPVHNGGRAVAASSLALHAKALDLLNNG
jgi:histidinol phosphatase-like enzyme (inositol monophosphatase family)